MKKNEGYSSSMSNDVKARIEHILRAKNLNASQLAEQMEIGGPRLSHIMTGRNEPSAEFFIKLKKLFPEYSLDWLMMGKLPMTISEPYSQTSIFEYPRIDSKKSDEGLTENNTVAENQNSLEFPDSNSSPIVQSESKERKIVKLIALYSDNTFAEFKPSSL